MVHHMIVFRHFSRVAGYFLAVSQVLFGLALLGVQLTGIFFDLPSTHLGATGVWGGPFIVLAGICGFLATRLRTPGALMSFLVLGVFATLIASAVVVTSTISVMKLQEFCETRMGSAGCEEKEFMLNKTLDISLILIAIVEYCLAVSCVITCSWTLCCDPAGYQAEPRDDTLIAKQNSMEMQDTSEDSGDRLATIPEMEQPTHEMRNEEKEQQEEEEEEEEEEETEAEGGGEEEDKGNEEEEEEEEEEAGGQKEEDKGKDEEEEEEAEGQKEEEEEVEEEEGKRVKEGGEGGEKEDKEGDEKKEEEKTQESGEDAEKPTDPAHRWNGSTGHMADDEDEVGIVNSGYMSEISDQAFMDAPHPDVFGAY